MLFLAWTVTPSRAGTGRADKRRASSTTTSPNSSGSPRITDKRAKEAQQQSLFFGQGSTLITSSSSSTGGDSDLGLVPSKLPDTNKLQQQEPHQQQQNIRANMSIPLRGRSQSSYSTFDISATVTRRKGSADDIVELIPRPQRDVGSPVLSPESTGPPDPSQRANMGESAHVMDPREVVKKGRLFKLSISKKLGGDKTPVWKQRDFVLSGYYLSYLDSMKRRNEFDLRGCTVTSLIVHKGPGLSMDLYAITINTANNSRHIVLGGSSEEHRDEWVRCLEAQLVRQTALLLLLLLLSLQNGHLLTHPFSPPPCTHTHPPKDAHRPAGGGERRRGGGSEVQGNSVAARADAPQPCAAFHGQHWQQTPACLGLRRGCDWFRRRVWGQGQAVRGMRAFLCAVFCVGRDGFGGG